MPSQVPASAVAESAARGTSPVAEREADRAEDDDLRQVLEGLGSGLGADQPAAVEAEMQEEGRCDRARRADRRREQSDDAPGGEHAPARGAPRAPAAIHPEAQPRGPPGGDQHEHADRDLRARARHAARERDAREGHRQQRGAEAREQAPAHVAALRDGAREVRDELHHAVDRDRDEGVHEEQHQREQGDAAGHAHHRGERPRRDRGSAEQREDARVDHAQAAAAPCRGPT